jgi:hypothetical protein
VRPLPTAKKTGEALKSHCGYCGGRSLPTTEIQTHLSGSPCRGLVRALIEFLMSTVRSRKTCEGLNTEFQIVEVEN